jgi:putative FmdB family regulatory protein
MPLYEYECEKCGHRFEKIQKFSDKMVKKCPECGGKVEQMISAPAVQFKGSGWYVTDYANKSHAPSDGGKDSKKDEKSKSEGSSKDSSAKEGSSTENSSKESSSKESTSKDGSTKESSSRESSGRESSSKESTTRVSSSRKPDKRK